MVFMCIHDCLFTQTLAAVCVYRYFALFIPLKIMLFYLSEFNFVGFCLFFCSKGVCEVTAFSRIIRVSKRRRKRRQRAARRRNSQVTGTAPLILQIKRTSTAPDFEYRDFKNLPWLIVSENSSQIHNSETSVFLFL